MISFIFSMILSSVNTVLIFMISVTGLLTLWVFIKRRDKFNYNINATVAYDEETLSEEEIERILSYNRVEDSETTDVNNV